MRLTIANPTSRPWAGNLRLKLPEGVACGTFAQELSLAAGQRKPIDLEIRRTNPGSWLRDKNLIRAVFVTEREDIAAQTVFGLGGARQWLVYGPYWDMWDKTKNRVCPYQNEQVCCNPSAIGYNDYYNHHLRRDHQYLDEAALLAKELPGELPLAVEAGEDLLTERDLGGFMGQACYYLVRNFRSTGFAGESELALGRTGPCIVWLDGRQLVRYDNMRGWAPDESAACTLTGNPQRLVVKLMRLADTISFSVQFIAPADPSHRKGISRYADCLEDLPPDPAR